ncbi:MULTISPECIES: adenosine deaminase [Actinomadura]|uniref:Adenosine deaminase n=1 Tax=Actinomadura yumaensis TaxID=111807 RepID=A0ABW2D1N9_9ACTN|nr:adenosine deaminase [Actinomadura sp. J1-007]
MTTETTPASAPRDTALTTFIDALPKVELHVHLVGSASVPTVLELARRHPDGGVPTDEARLRDFYRFRDFPHFARVYDAVNLLVRTPEDVATLVLGTARDLAAQNVRYFELTVSPYAHVRAGMSYPAVTEALDLAVRRARERHGIEIAYIFDIPADFGAEAVTGTLTAALDHPAEALVGFGIGGVEQMRAPIRDEIRDAFRAARAAGLRSLPHAGEMTGPETMWEAVDQLGAERIGHGIACVRDERLMAHLRDTATPLEVCPTSNVCTGQVAGLADHPLPRMLDAGLFVTLNSDDPPMFDTTLTGEYRVAADVFGLGRADLAALARNAVTASSMAEPAKRTLIEEIDALA